MPFTHTQDAHAGLIAVTGASGQQGAATTHALLNAGSRVRALTRSVESPIAHALADAGAEIVPFDLDDPASVRTGLTGADRVFAMTPIAGEREITYGRLIADTAQACGASFLLYTSVGGAERHSGVPHFVTKRAVERHLDTLTLATAVIRPVFFMDNLLESTIEDDEVVVRIAIPHDLPMQLISSTDIGRVAAAILLDPSRITEPVEIATDRLTGPQIAGVFAAHAQRAGRFESLPLAALAHTPELQAMFEWFNTTDSYDADYDTTHALDPDAMDLTTWLATTNWPDRQDAAR